MEDHPRLRGEKHGFLNYTYMDRGSPPLTRGKASSSAKLPVFFGITPAYAGKSLVNLGMLRDIEDHPRLRGEKRF